VLPVADETSWFWFGFTEHCDVLSEATMKPAENTLVAFRSFVHTKGHRHNFVKFPLICIKNYSKTANNQQFCVLLHLWKKLSETAQTVGILVIFCV